MREMGQIRQRGQMRDRAEERDGDADERDWQKKEPRQKRE